MKRLTERLSDGTADPNCSECEYYEQIGDEYECNSPSGCEQAIYDRLCELEDKLESGQMVELPCKVGDTVYQINYVGPNNSSIVEIIVGGFDINKNLEIRIIDKYGFLYIEYFLTKAAAEARLKELQEQAGHSSLPQDKE